MQRPEVKAKLEGRTFPPERCKAMSVIRTGKKQSLESSLKKSKKLKGQKRSPETCANIKALIWWNNGVKDIRARVCPGDGWVRGRCNANCAGWNQTPEAKALLKEIATKRMANLELREQQRQRALLGWEKRRAKQAAEESMV
jgi:hypothetical protein